MYMIIPFIVKQKLENIFKLNVLNFILHLCHFNKLLSYKANEMTIVRDSL